MLSSESSSSDSESGTISQALPQRGTQRKRTYEPPQGAVLIGGPDSEGGIVETGKFDWNSIKDDKNIELWLVRIPNSVCPFLWFIALLPPSFGLFIGSCPVLRLFLWLLTAECTTSVKPFSGNSALI